MRVTKNYLFILHRSPLTPTLYKPNPIGTMKRSVIFFCLLLTAFFTHAQTAAPKATVTSVIIDSSGMKYPAMLWQQMVRSGDYWLKAVDASKQDTPFLLVKYTQEQKEYWFARMPKPAESTFFKTGQVIKPFKIKDINGKKIEAKDWAGKTLVFNYWFIGCPPCRAEIPELNRLALKYKEDPNVIFVGFALDGASDIEDFVKTHPFGYRLVGGSADYAHQFDIHLYPTNVVIDKEGKVRLHYVSAPANGGYWIDKTIQEIEKGI
jgi:thiol-disulfide isomerase/thioredoxin